MKYLYKSTSIKAIKTAFYIVLFGLLILGQMSCESKSKIRSPHYEVEQSIRKNYRQNIHANDSLFRVKAISNKNKDSLNVLAFKAYEVSLDSIRTLNYIAVMKDKRGL